MKEFFLFLASLFGGPNEVTIYFQPFDYTDKEVAVVQKQMENNFASMVNTTIHYETLPAMKLPNECLNEARNRYRAPKILDILPKKKGVVIGLTHQDIAASVHGVSDYGILGQSRMKSDVCIVSDRRIRNKADIWKVVSHEFIHAYYDYGHCPEDDPTCIIKDAKGRENLSRKKHLCETCQSNINKTRK